MPNLISTFIEVVTAGGAKLADAIREMNAALDTKYSNSRLREWERGDRQPTADVVNYMIEIVLPELLSREMLKNTRIKSIVRKCILPQHD